MPVLERADDETAAEMPRFLRLWSASCFSSFAPARVSLRIIRCLSGAGRRLRCCVSAQDRRDTLSSAYRFFRHIFPSPSCILRPDGRMPAVPFLKQIHEKLSLSIRQHRAVKSRNKPSAARFRKSRHRTALSLSHYNNGRYGTEILRKLRNAPPPKRYPAPLSCLTALGGSGFPATERLQTEA